jgi:putative phosphoesterase
MLVGIISDTHDDMRMIRRAVQLLNSLKAGFVLHAGDIVSPFTFEELGKLKAGFAAVFGNNDGDRILLREKSGDRVFNQPLITELSGRKFAVFHEPDIALAAARSGDFDVVVYGHTHRPEIKKAGRALLINPGKVAALLKGKSTLALLETDTLEARIAELSPTHAPRD